jgi:hypothetical protein
MHLYFRRRLHLHAKRSICRGRRSSDGILYGISTKTKYIYIYITTACKCLSLNVKNYTEVQINSVLSSFFTLNEGKNAVANGARLDTQPVLSTNSSYSEDI